MNETLYTIKNLSITDRAKEILSIESLSIKKGVLYELSGPNGSGKTTLMKVLNRLIIPPANSVFYKDNDIRKSENSIRNDTIYLHQSPYPLDMSVYDNIITALQLRHYSRKDSKLRAEEIISQLNLSSIAAENARKLSGGELQKCAIARAAVLNCEVYLFDEPVSGIDKNSIHDICALLETLVEKEQKTVLFSTHTHLHFESLKTDTIQMNKGRIQAQ